MLRIPIILSSDKRDASKYSTSDFVLELDNQFNFTNGNYYISVNRLDSWYSNPNIQAAQLTHQFTYNDGTTDQTLTLPDGIYGVDDLLTEIYKFMYANGDYTGTGTYKEVVYPIIITPNTNTGRFDFQINSPYSIDFTTSNIYRLFGATAAVYSADFTGPSRGDIGDGTNQLYVNCDLCLSSGLLGGSNDSVIFVYTANTKPYGPINLEPSLRSLVQITAGRPRKIRVWLTDNLGRPVDLRGEAFSISCDIIQKE